MPLLVGGVLSVHIKQQDKNARVIYRGVSSSIFLKSGCKIAPQNRAFLISEGLTFLSFLSALNSRSAGFLLLTGNVAPQDALLSIDSIEVRTFVPEGW